MLLQSSEDSLGDDVDPEPDIAEDNGVGGDGGGVTRYCECLVCILQHGPTCRDGERAEWYGELIECLVLGSKFEDD